jgi:isocitrate dehydrogenase
MHIYINSFDFNRLVFEDLDIHDVNQEDLFVTKNGIYKLYKQHFYKLNYEQNEYYAQNEHNMEVLVQKYDTKIIKENPLTSFPLQTFMIKRVQYHVIINENINMIKSIDNNITENYYFELLNDIPVKDAIEQIGLYLYEKINN